MNNLAGRSFHLMGIGGAGMSVVAELLLDEGAHVSGCDAKENAATRHLAQRGAHISVGHDAEHITDDISLVVSSAIKSDNPEFMYAHERGIEILHRSQALALASESKSFVAVAGSHGKTTTSAMIATALEAVGMNPSWAVGSSVLGYASGGHVGTGDVMVAEADESDGSFLNYTPSVALVTNVENDHLDHYASREDIEAVFHEFAKKIVPEGVLVVCADDEGAARVGKRALAEGITVASYGIGEGLEGELFHVAITDVAHVSGRPVGHFTTGDVNVSLTLEHAVGVHNLLNAAGAWAVARVLGCNLVDFAHALENFAGTGRRFEERGVVAGVRVIDDYGHHPTEVAATIRAAREQAQRVRVLFQPHLYSRTRDFAEQFAHALSLADDVIVTAVYGAREEPMDGVEGNIITEKMSGALFIPDRFAAAKEMAARAKAGDIVLTMGAGDVTEVAPVILEELS